MEVPVDNDPAGPPAPHQPSGTRRKFLREVGIGGAAAALIGLTEVAGLPSAQAAARNSPGGRPARGKTVRGVRGRPDANPVCGTLIIKYDGGHCTNTAGAACPKGSCCYHFSGENLAGQIASFNMCYPTNTGRAKGCPRSFFITNWCGV
jgi:hypothetical protein